MNGGLSDEKYVVQSDMYNLGDDKVDRPNANGLNHGSADTVNNMKGDGTKAEEIGFTIADMNRSPSAKRTLDDHLPHQIKTPIMHDPQV
jgi:hypothetical protein